MAKSLTETAKSILMKESNDPTPDRDAKNQNSNSATLRPKSKVSEDPFANPGSIPPNAGEVEDLGDAVVSPMDERKGPANAATGSKKDVSASSQSRKGAVPGENSKEQEEVMEEDFEISEELENFINEKIEEGLSEEEITKAIEEEFDLVSEDEDSVNEDNENIEEEIDVPDLNEDIDLKEDVEVLLKGEELSEEFREKAKTIFEAAVKTRLDTYKEKLKESYKSKLEEETNRIQENIVETVDDYLNYAVEQWVNNNEVAIEAGLRTELTEEFISGLKQLFQENYIDVPEDKVSLVEELGNKVRELEIQLNEQIDKNVNLTKVINESKRNEVFTEETDGLTDMQVSKLESLAENLDYSHPDEFRKKVRTLRESYFPSNVRSEKVLDNEKVDDKSTSQLINENLEGHMKKYVEVLGKKLPN